MKMDSVKQDKIQLIFPEINQTKVLQMLDYAVKCPGRPMRVKICIKSDTALYSVQQQLKLSGWPFSRIQVAYYHDVSMMSPPLRVLTSQWRLTCCGWTPWRRPGGCTSHGVTFLLWVALSAPPSQPSSPEPSARTRSASPAGTLSYREQRHRIYWHKSVLHCTTIIVLSDNNNSNNVIIHFYQWFNFPFLLHYQIWLWCISIVPPQRL